MAIVTTVPRPDSGSKGQPFRGVDGFPGGLGDPVPVDARAGEFCKLRGKDLAPTHIKDLAFDPYRSLAWNVREHHGYVKNTMPFPEFKWANFFRTRILLDQDILAGKHTFDDFAFEVDEHGRLEVTDDGKEVLEEALFTAWT